MMTAYEFKKLDKKKDEQGMQELEIDIYNIGST